MNPIEAVGSFFGNYTNFSGRAPRSEYWWCALLLLLSYILLYLVTVAIGIVGLVLIVFHIAIVIPYLALSVRRLHDTNRSGWWLLINFVPFGGIVTFIFSVLPSTVGSNKYGP